MSASRESGLCPSFYVRSDKDTMETQKHIEVTCPGLIKNYNANMCRHKYDMLLAL